MDDDLLALGRLICDYDDGELVLLALWYELKRDVFVMTSVVLDSRECLN